MSDRGFPRLTADSTTKVIIQVDDANDSPPKFKAFPSEAVVLLPTFKGKFLRFLKDLWNKQFQVMVCTRGKCKHYLNF